MAKSNRRLPTHPTKGAPLDAGAEESAKTKSARLTKLLTDASQLPGSIAIQSGSVSPSVGELYFGPPPEPGPNFSGESVGERKFWRIPAPRPGEVLWADLAFPWGVLRWQPWGRPVNNYSNHSMRVNFGLTWRWELFGDSTAYVPGPFPMFMTDFDRYEHYTSIPPGGRGIDVSCVLPARSVTLTADSKVSDPTPLEMLLRGVDDDGHIGVVKFLGGQDFVANGQKPFAGYITGGPDYLYYTWAVRVPKVTRPPTKDTRSRRRRWG
jgi:hypothetical protein